MPAEKVESDLHSGGLTLVTTWLSAAPLSQETASNGPFLGSAALELSPWGFYACVI